MSIEENIIDVLRKSNKPLSKREIARRIEVSSATACKYIDILQAKGQVKLSNYGNIHLIELGEKDGN